MQPSERNGALRHPPVQATSPVRTRWQLANKPRELALLDLALESKLRDCDLMALHVNHLAHGGHVFSRATIIARYQDGIAVTDAPSAEQRGAA